MRGRKHEETDAQYIARLEMANDQLRRNNSSLTERMGGYNERAAQAASYTAAVLHVAAEATGLADDPGVLSAVEVLDALIGLRWSRDAPRCGNPLALPKAAGSLGGDAEMVLTSAYERVLCNTGSFDLFNLSYGLPWPRRQQLDKLIRELCRLATANLEGQARRIIDRPAPSPFAPAKVETLQDARELVEALSFEVYDVLADLEFSRAMLRLDLRAGMYEAAFQRLAQALRSATAAVEDVPPAEPSPFGAGWELDGAPEDASQHASDTREGARSATLSGTSSPTPAPGAA
jgi:hypothetical protein